MICNSIKMAVLRISDLKVEPGKNCPWMKSNQDLSILHIAILTIFFLQRSSVAKQLMKYGKEQDLIKPLVQKMCTFNLS